MKMMDDLDKDIEGVIETGSTTKSPLVDDGQKIGAGVAVKDDLQFESTPASEDDDDSVGSNAPLTPGGTMSLARRKRRRLRDLQAALEDI